MDNTLYYVGVPLIVLGLGIVAFRTLVISSSQSALPPDPTAALINRSMKGVFQFTAKLASGAERALSHYNDGKPLIIANVASRCGYTKGGYDDIKTLKQKFGDKFLWQEPGSIDQVCEFAKKKGAEDADMFDKIAVKGSNAHPLYKFLSTSGTDKGPVKWNFEFFLVAPDTGEVAKRFRSGDRLNKPEVFEQIESLMGKRTDV